MLASHATREREGSLEDPVKDELDFTEEMKKRGFKSSCRWFQNLNVPSEE